MTANNELTPLQKRVLETVRCNPGQTVNDLYWAHLAFHWRAEVDQALAQLIALNLISVDEDLRYHAVGGEL